MQKAAAATTTKTTAAAALEMVDGTLYPSAIVFLTALSSRYQCRHVAKLKNFVI